MSTITKVQRQAYGKANVRVTKVIRTSAEWNDIVELTCQTIERYGYDLAKHFITRYDHVTHAHVHIVQELWYRITVNGEPHSHSFYRDGSETRQAWLTVTSNSVSIKSGLEGLLVLKTTGSSFTNFNHCANTTLHDPEDRIFLTIVKAHYSIDTAAGVKNIPFDQIFEGVRKTILDVFSHDDFASVQATMYSMANLTLKRFPEAKAVYHALPNIHYFNANLAPFKLVNSGLDITIFSPITDFSGLITATIG